MKQAIIIGGGASVRDADLDKLDKRLEEKFVIGCNFAYKFLTNITLTAFVDKNSFYEKQKEELKNLPLVVGAKNTGIKEEDNLILLKTVSKFDPSFNSGIYNKSLCGVFSLSLAIYLGAKEIMLFGYDFGDVHNKKERFDGKILTHWYQDKFIHRGTGKCAYYENNNYSKGYKLFNCFNGLKNIKIYNVSPNSNLNEFEKIDYNKFFKLLDWERCNQNQLRENIKERLKCIK